ncbi:laccase-1-like isoform X2 [Zootermopsis nevadensis]|uniref:Laccase-4 n=1 Tax=Zootermopsis nevadensis TaxID=136037 RepID=A0A067QPY0_ZOONE|nr:laccase-1-like isoform X2 [Zootermopsis nevadensis]KDR11749.1 Laccase-4 [Zootermopsis nevadensis]
MWPLRYYILSTVLSAGFTTLAELVDLEEFLQPDSVLNDEIAIKGRRNYSNRCYRTCIAGAEPMTCYYRWTIEDYNTLGAACGACPLNETSCFNPQCVTADGYERGILTVNRGIPGPSIQVCQGDRIIVDVKNNMLARTTTIHWHGIFQKGTPYMDGVPMVTQCPINEGQIFRYDFVAKNAGTHFWHSHDGLQKMDGLVGNLVVREPRSYDPNSHLYDYDLSSHVILITDWFHLDGDQHFPGLRTHDQGQNPDTFLVNGLGRYLRTSLGVPYAVFRVSRGKRYRFRLVGGTCTVCPSQVSVESHSLLLIATDGNPIEPVRVDSIVLYPGERYDVVLEANQAVASYWIHVKGIGPCTADEPYQLAVLRYIGDRRKEPGNRKPGYDGFNSAGPVLNPDGATCNNGSSGICIPELRSYFPVDSAVLKPIPDVHLELGFGFHTFSIAELFLSNTYHRFLQPPGPVIVSSIVNNISNIFPPSPILSQPQDIPTKSLCPAIPTGVPKCGSNYCECFNVIQVPLGSIVQVLLVDTSTVPGTLHHPFHLHGFAFRTLGVGVFGAGHTLSQLRADLQAGIIPQASPRPTAKDTMAIPSAGYGVIRFRADNPGYWIFHCHFLYHLATGMSVVLHVGDREDLPLVPRGFPRCGNFLSPVKPRATDRQHSVTAM